MEALRATITGIEEVLEKLQDGAQAKELRNVEEQMRRYTKTALRRSDLRLPTEMLLAEIDGSFRGFDHMDRLSREVVVEECTQKLERLKIIEESNQAIKEDAIELPPPPEYVRKDVEAEERKIREEKEAFESQLRKKRQAAEGQKQREEAKRRMLEKKKEARERGRSRQEASSDQQRGDRREPKPVSRPDNRPPRQQPPQKQQPQQAQPKPQQNQQRQQSQPRQQPPQQQQQPQQQSAPQRQPQRQQTRAPEFAGKSQLSRPVTHLSGVGPVISERFEFKNIQTIRDLVMNPPRDYEDRRKITPIKDLKENDEITCVAKVENVFTKSLKGRRVITTVLVADDTGKLAMKFFGVKPVIIRNSLPVGESFVFSGKVEMFKGKPELHHPDYEMVKNGTKPEGKILPVYSETDGLNSRKIHSLILSAMEEYVKKDRELLPADLLKKHNLMSFSEALEMVHAPRGDVDYPMLKVQATEGHRRLVFDEMFYLQVGVMLRRRHEKDGNAIVMNNSEVFEKVRAALPFDLTKGQNEAVAAVMKDLAQNKPMNRLVQGDVGSGKTVVALIAAAVALESGCQVAFMVPTEVLAEQHMTNLGPLVEKLGFKAVLLTGGQDAAQKDEVRKQIESGAPLLVIGTHSLIQDSVKFAKLGLAIIDEQHRFGVAQRRKLAEKGENAHLLTMSATPIPRSLALTIYGDMDITIIPDKPQGRKPVRTQVLKAAQRKTAYARMREIMKSGRRGFVVYPIVNTGETDLKDAVSEAEKLATEQFKDFRVGLLHGKMQPAEKEAVVNAFAAGDLDLLVATTVIEVGIDIPAASAIIIEHADRFGLATLHQLRGRVGRDQEQGDCFLICSETESEAGLNRLKLLERTHDGLALAEKDMELRGEGDLLGIRQHGIPTLRIANLSRDMRQLEIAREEAERILRDDPTLQKSPEHQALLETVNSWWGFEHGEEG